MTDNTTVSNPPLTDYTVLTDIIESAKLQRVSSQALMLVTQDLGEFDTAHTTTVLNLTGVGTVANVDDFIQIATYNTDAKLVGVYRKITAVAANQVTVDPGFPSVPVDGTYFNLLRVVPTPILGNPLSQTAFASGSVPVSNALGKSFNLAADNNSIATFQVGTKTSPVTNENYILPIGGQYDEVSSTNLSEGQYGSVRSTSRRAMFVNLRNETLGVEVGTSSNPIYIQAPAGSGMSVSALQVADGTPTAINSVGGTLQVIQTSPQICWTFNGTFTNAAFEFEGQDPSGNWASILAYNPDENTIGTNTGAFSSGFKRFLVNGLGFTFCRIRCTAISSGSVTCDYRTLSPFFEAVQPIQAASLPLPTGAATSALQTTGNTSLGGIDISTSALANTIDVDTVYTFNPGLRTLGYDFNYGVWAPLPLTNYAATVAVDIAYQTISLATTLQGPPNATVNPVSASASSVTLLAANYSRRGAKFTNNSTAILYLKEGTTASTSSFTTILQPGGYYEIPQGGYLGRIDGIWSAAVGACLVTENT